VIWLEVCREKAVPCSGTLTTTWVPHSFSTVQISDFN